MSRKVRWGILSTANIGRKRVVPAIQESGNGQVEAVASREVGKARAFAAELNIPKAYGSYEELIDDPNIDAIYNPLPNHLHAEWSIRCAEAGKPVLCEKPLASDAAEAQRMVDAFAERGVLLAEAFMYRFHPQTQRVKMMIQEGALGEVQLIESSFTFRITNDDNIRLRKDMAGGGLMDVGCYCVNVMRFLTDEEPEQVGALAHFGGRSGVDEWLVGMLSFPSGILGHFDCGLRSAFKNSYDVRGTAGRVLVEAAFVPDMVSGTILRYWHEDQYEEIKVGPANHYQIMVEDFAGALLDARPPRFPAQDGVHNMQVIDRLLASLRG